MDEDKQREVNQYPGDILEPEQAEAEHAFKMAEAFVTFVMQLLPDSFRLKGLCLTM